MAVQASLLLPVREVADNAIERKQGYGNYRMGFVSPPYAPFSVPMPAAAAESGVTFANARARAEEQPLGVAAHDKRRVLDVDPAVLQHVEQMSAELEHLRRHARQAVARRLVANRPRTRRSIGCGGSTGRWRSGSGLRGMCAEAQAWRDLALSHDAAATARRADLDHALWARGEAHARLAADDPGDAESCCYGDKVEEDAEATSGGRCRGDERASLVLVLPCRHLCASGCAKWRRLRQPGLGGF